MKPRSTLSSLLLGCSMPLFLMLTTSIVPKIAPQAVKSTEILEGDGGVGTIKKINFGEGSTYSYVKHRIDGIDKENFVYKYSVIAGDAISETIEKISYETKLVASGSGSVVKSTSHYHTKGDFEIKEEHVKAGNSEARDDIRLEKLDIILRAPLEDGEEELKTQKKFCEPSLVLESVKWVIWEKDLTKPVLEFLQGGLFSR